MATPRVRQRASGRAMPIPLQGRLYAAMRLDDSPSCTEAQVTRAQLNSAAFLWPLPANATVREERPIGGV